jgi:hypothetical protein
MMTLYLYRTYFSEGTNGKLVVDGKLLCYTIEPAWRDNQKRVSCIPEGKYELRKRYSARFGWHIEVVGVVNRDCILIHPANDAQRELQGCIAPVLKISGEGTGLYSRKAFDKVVAEVYAGLNRNEEVYLIVES